MKTNIVKIKNTIESEFLTEIENKNGKGAKELLDKIHSDKELQKQLLVMEQLSNALTKMNGQHYETLFELTKKELGNINPVFTVNESILLNEVDTLLEFFLTEEKTLANYSLYMENLERLEVLCRSNIAFAVPPTPEIVALAEEFSKPEWRVNKIAGIEEKLASREAEDLNETEKITVLETRLLLKELLLKENLDEKDLLRIMEIDNLVK